MNPTTQHEFHPDTESLSAFAEQALDERERGQVLAHLAVCGRCRRVVALAQEAGLDAEVQAPAAGRAAIQPYAWWRRWRFVWAPAAVAAALAVASISVYMRQAEPNRGTIKIAEQTVTENESTTSNQPQRRAQQERTQAALQAAAPESAMSPARSFKRESAGAAPKPSPLKSIATAAMPAESGGINHAEGSREETAPAPTGQGIAGEGLGADRTMAVYSQEPAVAALQEEQTQKAVGGAAPRRLYAAKATATASMSGTAGGAAGSGTEQVTVPAPQLEMPPAAAPRIAASAPSGTLINPDGAANTIHLPSGLRIQSMAAAGRRMLAIDTAGALFLSENSGETWSPVNRQWTGRAMKVRRQMAGSDMETVPTKFFELLNDQNQVWLSTDGKTWIAK
jgi:hypothetical protein